MVLYRTKANAIRVGAVQSGRFDVKKIDRNVDGGAPFAGIGRQMVGACTSQTDKLAPVSWMPLVADPGRPMVALALVTV